MANFSGGFQSHMTFREGAGELSESRYNLLIGAALTWGFFLNFLIVQFAGPAILSMALSSPAGYSTFMIGFLVAYIALVLIGSALVRSYNPARCFLGYNLIAVPVGVVVALATVGYDPQIVTRAALITAIVTLIMMIVSTLAPSVFARMGSGLGRGAAGRDRRGGVRDAAVPDGRFDPRLDRRGHHVPVHRLRLGCAPIRCSARRRTPSRPASALYLDIINIFLRVLRILARSRSND